ncbi:MAG: class I/II aminotransferase [Candidatus Gottesmanbacteria bacterium GW2011_GWA2_43_14]|uniref:Aminotransferase n=1 Tax=Candidatus Gottesmanbacteria bacterium GW2011_GWA2_43_14 TaxID=1618443 RepID=A0A0G1GHV1_9BACT|nr:MAG: class I/II aminotransferase [Candidatus Gottesmanbacteria bacterium GW2011_GWA2_43_14]
MKQHTHINKHSVLATSAGYREVPEAAERLKNTSVSVIKEMMYLGAMEKAKGRDIVSLGVGLPFYPAPQFIHEEVVKALKSKRDIDKYTLLTGLPVLRRIIAALSAQMLGFAVTDEEILVTPGSMAALFDSLLALVNPGDEVILPSPYFSSNAEQVSLASGKVVPVAMTIDGENGYRLDVAAIKKAISKKTKAIILNNPQNPTGAVFLKEDLMELAGILADTSVFVITDEVYDYLLFDNAEYFNIAKVKELWPRVIRCASLSKKYGMMGWRVGYLHTNKDLLMQILKIHDASIVCAPHISQVAAIAALTGPQKVVEHHRTMLAENREVILKRLDALANLFDYVRPLGTYYVFPEYKLNLSSIEMAKKLLYEAGVVTVPGIGFGRQGEHHLRLSYGSSIADINRAFDLIEKWLRKE